MGSESNEVEVQVSWKPTRTLVLVGRTGNGKSATGNCILGKPVFASKPRGKFVTKRTESGTAMLPNGVEVQVIDTPGLFSGSGSQNTEFTSREIIRCLQEAKNGIDAVLLVFSVDNRLTEEEKRTLPILKILFGRDIVNYMIVVFTHGDVFVDGDTLDDYLSDCDELQEIIKECGNRKVLFDNSRGASQDVKDKQVLDLLDLVAQISKNNNGKPYMSDLSLELKERGAKFEEKMKQIEETTGSFSKKEKYELEKEFGKKYEEMIKGVEEKITNQLKEYMNELEAKLATSEAAREEALKKMNEIQKLSSDEIKRLREQLKNAEKETASLRSELKNKCNIL